LKGYWKLRVGDWRVIYKIQCKTLTILRIGHRREIYGR
jgi:mRNA interferase RelE/StbE